MNFFTCYGNYHSKDRQRLLSWFSGLDPAMRRIIIMRINFVAFLLAISFMNVHASVYAQGISITVSNASLKFVLTEINKKSGYELLYNNKHFVGTKPVTITIKNSSLKNALDKCLEGQPLTYELIDKTIVIKPKPDGIKDKSIGILKKITLTGKVTDEAGKPLPGVNVRTKGFDTRTSTNEKGNFSIEVPGIGAVLQFSFVGFQSFDHYIMDASPLSITLKQEPGQLEEVGIVSTGYQQLPKERATGSFVQIDKELINRSISTDILARLKGVSSGLNFDKTADNTLGISIRGRSTILSNTSPLIVLDNFPYEGDLNNINPNDVESITILKDAAAASIWGTLAGNGVIVITTKSGRFNNALQIELNSNLTIRKKPDLFYNKQFLNAHDYINVEKMLYEKGFFDNLLNDNTNFPAVTPSVEIFDQLKKGMISQIQANEQIHALQQNDIRHDLSKYFYRNASLQQYSIGIQGGSEKARFVFSAGKDFNNNNELGNSYNRTTLNANATFKPIRNFEVSTIINYINSNTVSNSNVQSLTGPGAIYPYAKLAAENGNPLSVNKFYRQSFIDNTLRLGFLDWNYRPLEELDLADNDLVSSTIRINSGIKYDIWKGLSAEVRYQFEKSISDSRSQYELGSYTTRNLVNQYSVVIDDAISNRNIPVGAILNLSNNIFQTNSFRAQLNYNRNWNSHDLNVIAGTEIREVVGRGNASGIYGFDSNTGASKPVNYADLLPIFPSGGLSYIPNQTSVSGTTDRYRSYFANASYSFRNRYTMSFSGRFDKSNLFGVNTNQKGVPLWSAGAKWDINKEAFYKVNWIPALSLRTSYGFSGNVNKKISAYTISQYLENSAVPSNNYAWIVFPGNPDLRWEKIGILNIGLDFRLKHLFNGSFEYYIKKGSDLIGNSPIAASSGFLAATGNFADIRGNGYDFVLNSSLGNEGWFKWSSNLLISYAIDKVTKYKGGTTSAVDASIVEGKPFRAIFVNQFAGLDQNGDPQGYLNGTISKDYSALNRKPSTDKAYYLTQPKYFGSFRNTFSYKTYSVSLNLIFKAGYYFKRNGLSYGNLYNSGIGHSDFGERWQNPGDEEHTTVPALQYPTNSARDSFYGGSEAVISKGDHVRLQDITISHELNKSNWMTIPFNSLKIYAYFNNLGLLWSADKSGIDSDFQSGYKNPVSLSIGLKVGL